MIKQKTHMALGFLSITFFYPGMANSANVENIRIIPTEKSIIVDFNCKPGKNYNLSLKRPNSGSWEDIFNDAPCPQHGHAYTHIDKNIKCSTTYKIKIKKKNAWRNYKRSTTTKACITPSPPPPPGSIRLKHLQTGKCIYGYKKSTWLAYNWGCWPDPDMAFEKIDIDSKKFKLKHVNSGLCLLTQGTNGAQAKLNRCSYNWGAMIFVKEPTNNGRFRLKSMLSQCLYGTPGNGGSVNSWVCWPDPGMDFIFEYY